MKYQIVMVEWIDAEGDSGWNEIRHAKEHEVPPVVSVGWLIEENNRWIVLAGCIRAEGHEASSWDFIPTGCVVRRVTLWHPDTSRDWQEMWDQRFHRPEAL